MKFLSTSQPTPELLLKKTLLHFSAPSLLVFFKGYCIVSFRVRYSRVFQYRVRQGSSDTAAPAGTNSAIMARKNINIVDQCAIISQTQKLN